MSSLIEQINLRIIDDYFDYLKSQGNSDKESRLIINSPIVSRVLSKLSYKVLQSDIFQEVYGFSKEFINATYREEPSQGFGIIEWNTFEHDKNAVYKNKLRMLPATTEEKSSRIIVDAFLPLRHLYCYDDYYFDDEEEKEEDKLPHYDNIEGKDFIVNNPQISLEEENLMGLFEGFIPKNSWCFHALHWNSQSYQNILKSAEFKFIRQDHNKLIDELSDSHKDIDLFYLKPLADLKYIDLGHSFMSSQNDRSAVLGYLDSPIGILSYVQFKHIEGSNYDFALMSAATCYGYRRQGLSDMVLIGTLNSAFSENETIIRSSPGANTPAEYTNHLTRLMSEIKPLVMPHYAENIIQATKNELSNRKVKLSDEKERQLFKDIQLFLHSKETEERWENDSIIYKNTDAIKEIIDKHIASVKAFKSKKVMKTA